MLQFCKLFLLSCLLFVFSSAEASSANSRELGYSSYWSSSTTSYPTVAPTYSPTNGTDAPTKAPHVQYHGRGYNISDYYPDMDDDQFDYKMMEQQLKTEFQGKTIAEYNFEEILWFATMVLMATVLASIPIFLFMKARAHKRFNMKHMDKFLDDDEMSVYSAYSASTFGSRSLYDTSTHGYSHSSTFTYDEEDARSTRSCESEEDYEYKAPAIQNYTVEKQASTSPKQDEDQQRRSTQIENNHVEDASITTENVVQDSNLKVKDAEEDVKEGHVDIVSTDQKQCEVVESSVSVKLPLSTDEVVDHDETNTDKCASAAVTKMDTAEDNGDYESTIGDNENESTDNKVCSESDMVKQMDSNENICGEDVNEVKS